MASKIGNIVFDCENPRELSWFWADVLGYPRADYPPELKAELIASGVTEEELELRSVAEDPEGVGNRLFFQKVPEGKVVKNRLHLDINSTPGRHPTPAEVDAEKDRVTALGATVLRKTESSWGPFPEYFYVMADPEGNEFCIH